MRLIRNKRVRKPGAILNIAPMIDVVLLLLIFFMAVSHISKTDAEPINLPQAKSVEEINKEEQKRVIINVRQNGQIVVLGHVFTTDHVRAFLREEKRTRPAEDIRVLIRGDQNANWVDVQRVIQCCRDEGLTRIRVAAIRKGQGE